MHFRFLAIAIALLVVPSLARAETLQFQNQTPVPVVIQLSCVVGGKLQRDRPHLLNPSDKSPAVSLPGNKLLTIYEAKVPNRMLFQSVIPGGADDQSFSIQVDGTRLKLEKQRPKKP
jgi:hypothetical protein